jgi:hypothetical protein
LVWHGLNPLPVVAESYQGTLGIDTDAEGFLGVILQLQFQLSVLQKPLRRLPPKLEKSTADEGCEGKRWRVCACAKIPCADVETEAIDDQSDGLRYPSSVTSVHVSIHHMRSILPHGSANMPAFHLQRGYP